VKVILFLLVSMLSLAAYATERPVPGVRNRLEELAGKHALNCGRAATPRENQSRSNCALEAYKRKAPFFVQYGVIGTDAHVEEGLALDARGRLSRVWAISSSPLYGGKPSGKFEVDVCSAKSLRKLANNELTCDFNPQ
jgi:hypothetical protein